MGICSGNFKIIKYKNRAQKAETFYALLLVRLLDVFDDEDRDRDGGCELQNTKDIEREELCEHHADTHKGQDKNKHDEPPLVSLTQDEGMKSLNTLLDKLNQPIE